MVFGVRVTDVHTMVVRGDVRRVGRFFGRKPFWKKAIVTLNAGDSIDFYGEQASRRRGLRQGLSPAFTLE